jgi:hypothetical protein
VTKSEPGPARKIGGPIMLSGTWVRLNARCEETRVVMGLVGAQHLVVGCVVGGERHVGLRLAQRRRGGRQECGADRRGRAITACGGVLAPGANVGHGLTRPLSASGR